MTVGPSRPPDARDSGSTGEGGTGTTVCPIHNLRYPSQQPDGCVLCRRSAAPHAMAGSREITIPTSWIGAALSIAIGFAAFYALRPTPDENEVVPAAALLWGSKTDYARCGGQCARSHQGCEERCSKRPGEVQGCTQYCFNEVESCFGNCAVTYQKDDYPFSYYYGTQTMPDWSEVLLSSSGVGSRLMACADEPVVALAYVEVSDTPGRTNQVLVSAKDQPLGVAACVNTALSVTPFATSPLGPYAFLARFDGRHDRLKLVIEQAKVELEAAPRREPKQETGPIEGRIFDAQLALSQQDGSEALRQQALLGIEREQLQARQRELEARRVARQTPARTPKQLSPEEQTKLAAEETERQRRADEKRARQIAADAARENRLELERLQRINESYRMRERYRRQWY